jgi:hypothetical protein
VPHVFPLLTTVPAGTRALKKVRAWVG